MSLPITVAVIEEMPDPNEIKPFVAVGPSPEYSITVHKSTFDTGFMIVTIIFIVIVVVVLVICIIIANNQTQIVDPPQLEIIPATTPVISNGRALSTPNLCAGVETARWVGNRCVCVYPYEGENCTVERHDSKYVEAGIPNEEKISVTILSEHRVGGKSYLQSDSTETKTCSTLCSDLEACSGFIYREKHCTLLTGEVRIADDDNISYSAGQNSTLYMKSRDYLKFGGRIFIADFPRSIPPRHWLIKRGYNYLQLFPKELSSLDFFPNHIEIYGCYTGIYSLTPFSMADVPSLLQDWDPERCYIHSPGEFLRLPDHWRHRLPLYTMYVPS